MKRNMIIAGALAVAGIATYLLRRNRATGQVENVAKQPRSNHLTNAFSKAKQHANSMS